MIRAGIALVAAVAAGHALADTAAPTLARIVIDGTINPASAAFLEDAIGRAEREGARALVVELDTPGGLLPSTREMVKAVLAAPLPILVYVAPSGAHAGSAGVFLTLSAHVAAMAPGTNIGAAHPVGGQGQEITGPMAQKVENDTAAFVRAIATQRGRNADWAARAVRRSEAVTAEEAVRLKVVDFVARDVDDLVRQADGRLVEVGGSKRALALADLRDPSGHLRMVTYEMSLAQRVLNTIADPNIVYLLMMAGILGLYIELTHPGVTFPGIAGGICFLLALAALQVLPVNYSGLALILLGAGLLIAEAYLPTFGVVGAGGIIAFMLGSLFLFDTAGTGVAVSRALVFSTVGVMVALAVAIGVLVVRSQRRRVHLGHEGMIGQVGVARQRLAPDGTILVRGEYWTAESDVVIDAGERVEVMAVDGLRLRVRRKE